MLQLLAAGREIGFLLGSFGFPTGFFIRQAGFTLFQRIGCLAKLRFLIGLGQTSLLFFPFQCRQPRCKLLPFSDRFLLLKRELFLLAAKVDFPLFEFRTQRLLACFEFGLLLGERLTLLQHIGCLMKLRFLIGLGQTPLLFFRFQCRQARCKLLPLSDKLLLLQCELFLMAAEVVFLFFEVYAQRVLTCFEIGLLLRERLLQLRQVVLAFGMCRFALGNFVSLSGEFTSLVVQFPFVFFKFGRLLRSLRFPGSLLPFELLLFRIQPIEVGR